MNAVAKPSFTVAEYLAIENAAEYRSEYYDGEMFAMAGVSGSLQLNDPVGRYNL